MKLTKGNNGRNTNSSRKWRISLCCSGGLLFDVFALLTNVNGMKTTSMDSWDSHTKISKISIFFKMQKKKNMRRWSQDIKMHDTNITKWTVYEKVNILSSLFPHSSGHYFNKKLRRSGNFILGILTIKKKWYNKGFG